MAALVLRDSTKPESGRRRSGSRRDPVSSPATEAALVEDLLRYLPHALAKAKIARVVRREVGVGRSIADVVCLAMRGQSAAFRDPLSVLESVVLATLRRKGPTRIDILERRCGLPSSGLRDGSLRRLEAWGLLTFTRGGRVAVRSHAGRFHVIAIEAKLFRWREALEQAAAYTRYADEAYVALPARFSVAALRARDLFVEAGVGLLVVEESGMKVAIAATPARDHGWRREFVISRLAAGPLKPGAT